MAAPRNRRFSFSWTSSCSSSAVLRGESFRPLKIQNERAVDGHVVRADVGVGSGLVLKVETQLEAQALKGIELEPPLGLGDGAELARVVEIRKESQLRREVLCLGDVPDQIGADDPFGLEVFVESVKPLSAAETRRPRRREDIDGLPRIIQAGDVGQEVPDAPARGNPWPPGLAKRNPSLPSGLAKDHPLPTGLSGRQLPPGLRE